MSWWWLSFADPDRPTGTQFLGACIIEGDDLRDAAWSAHICGCNPGGEVAGMEIPKIPPVQWRMRILTKDEAGQLDDGIKDGTIVLENPDDSFINGLVNWFLDAADYGEIEE